MSTYTQALAAVGVHLDNALIPKPTIDLSLWTVVACDQYTSEPEYWKDAEIKVGKAPSTLRLIYPEVWLERETEESKEKRIEDIRSSMSEYADGDLFTAWPCPIILERTLRDSNKRIGILLSLDLDKYDFAAGSQSLIRATEGTIIDRLPPRVKVREGAILELPHILILIDDSSRSVIEPIYSSIKSSQFYIEAGCESFAVQKNGDIGNASTTSSSLSQGVSSLAELSAADLSADSSVVNLSLADLSAADKAESVSNIRKLYDFDLMNGSGHLRGWSVQNASLLNSMAEALTKLANPKEFSRKYNTNDKLGILLFAVGDGNHSLATAKVCWDTIKAELDPSLHEAHPAKHALVEVVNIHDEGLRFEPIHRILFNADFESFQLEFFSWHREQGIKVAVINDQDNTYSNSNTHVVEMLCASGKRKLLWENPTQQLAVGSLQLFLDNWLLRNPDVLIDYVHGYDVVLKNVSNPRNIGFILPSIQKKDLFSTVIKEGALPRKAFSMGEAHDKRFYLECRSLV